MTDLNHNEKKQEAVRMAAAEFLVREASPQSLITVTRAELSSDAKRANIFITVFPDRKRRRRLRLPTDIGAILASSFQKNTGAHMHLKWSFL